jgi:hypothetical protein
MVLATVQGGGDIYVRGAKAGSGQFTIFVSKAPASPATLKLAWFVMSVS